MVSAFFWKTCSRAARWRPRAVAAAGVYVTGGNVLVLSIGTAAAVLLGNSVPVPLRLLGVIVVEVFLMTYVVMPKLTRWLSAWIYPSAKPGTT